MRALRLNGQGLRALPRAVFDHADTLELLDLSGNALDTLPPELARLRRLRILFASSNPFTELPAVLGKCPALEMVGFKSNAIAHVPAQSLPPRLRWLILTDNALEALPDALGQRQHLQKLMLAGNRLRALPTTLRGAPALELLRLSANRFSALPEWLPQLPRLTWLAWGGNPLTEAPERAALQAAAARAVPANALQVGDRLGEGASGVIHHARWPRPNDGTLDVALKRFKGQVTSDGWPHSEMAACLAAGAHPALVPVHGPLATAPGGPAALVLGRVPDRFRPLAAPPSFDSCTRDIYPADLRLDWPRARALLHGVASAMAQLHARGVVHGDLYAHNLLWDGQQALLSDFGAAAFLPPGQAGLHAGLRALDVRAFGVLLDECLARTTGLTGAQEQALGALRAQGLAAGGVPTLGFAAIAAALADL
jgi:hypothetical protein